MRIVFVAIGDELLLGETREDNGFFLSQWLSQRGLVLEHSQQLPDKRARIAEALLSLSIEPTLILVSGGLGPTDDDLTRDAVADALSVQLVCHEDLKEELTNQRSSLNAQSSRSNLRQAYAPEGARVLKNPVGTAPCFIASLGESRIFCLPGVPREFRKLVDLYLDALLDEIGVSPDLRPEVLLKVFGETESALQDRMERIESHDQVWVRSLPKFPEIWLKIKARGDHAPFEEFVSQLETELDWRVFARDVESTYAGTLVNELRASDVSLALAESCTGGLIAHMITSVAGSSDVFWGGAVAYANEAKRKILGVREDTIREHGAVSAPVAEELARGLRREYKTTVGLSVTGIAGPGGGSREKPIGTVFLGLSTPDGTETWRYDFPDMGRGRIQTLSAYVGLGKVRSWLARRS